MATLWRSIYENASTRVLALAFVFLIALTGFFLILGYNSQINLLENTEITKLESIANTLALQIDGDEHQQLLQKYPNVGQIDSNHRDPIYNKIHTLLQRTKLANNMDDEMYTLVYNNEQKIMEFGVTSGENPYYRAAYEKYPKALLENFETGGVLGQYESENGTWLSAYVPLKNSQGKTIALLEVDQSFDQFISLARSAALKKMLITLAVIVVIGFFFLRAMKNILRKEDVLTKQLLHNKALVEAKNKSITASIRYAKRIQEAILPSREKILGQFPNSFLYYQPRDIVSGDFYWYEEVEDGYIMAIADCTGHGVPGAFMSMIGHTLLNDIVVNQKTTKPSDILESLDRQIKNALHNSSETSAADGMDLAIVKVAKNFKSLQFSGANRPLILIREGELIEIKGTRRPIGGHEKVVAKHKFYNQEVDLLEGDTIYLFSDGYPDQLGGIKGKKFMTRKFKTLIHGMHNLAVNEQRELLHKSITNWMNPQEGEDKEVHPQTDDILVAGIHIKYEESA